MSLSPDDGDLELVHEINVTPFIDVMLVLLIIFMVAAPLATVDAPMDLPTSHATAHPPEHDPVSLAVDAQGHWTLDRQSVSPAHLKSMLEQRTGGDHQRRILLHGDRHLTYGQLMQAINAVRDAGYSHLALVGLEAPPK